ncbi:hypothetical protein GUITHDRAFT_102059 [Guillardia theta CCMP2712]|uniref:NTP pyrophosphohydrolase MazG-like domain-containing protein n=2 Tax=Guillardia theta TaxID=55529 RepID=L1JVN1_GUITC|nr:hypothetical protein GUITHDRAFT_102059 [Guillardia theta CCMP2712]EKX52158.1 hypothetical protein GUITHDRAFT_102059 [Guillardia theta CCMP2712]|eukprot:XP_005839138.1 hypothetical protein GUITHDRAFT_102059 [Guillardia theta CCMP2712]
MSGNHGMEQLQSRLREMEEKCQRLEGELSAAREQMKMLEGEVRQADLSHLSGHAVMQQQGYVEVKELIDVVEALTACPSSGGCPWTAEQGALDVLEHAHSELREIHEELSLGSASQHFALQSELGDLLFNAFLLVKICERDGIGGSTLAGAAASASAKIRRRAPFVFGEGARPLTPEEASALWKSVKEQEKAGLISTIPPTALSDDNGL